MDVLNALGREPAMYIGASWITTRETRPVINPADESVITAAPEANDSHVEQAMEAARHAQREWARRRSGVERGAALRAIAGGIRDRKEELARLVVAEQGKTITEARGEIDGAAAFFDYYASFERAQVGSMLAPDEIGEQLYIKSVPYGVVAAITPWNFPAAIFARKVAPAIMAGNAIVYKPSEETPLTSLALARIAEESGLPAGVVNVITGGPAVGEAMVRHPVSEMVSMTGSVGAGQGILAAAAEKIVPVSLELGGKAPFIVLEDADLDAAAKNAVNARFWNCGQVCTCNERTYVHRDVYEEFVERFVGLASSLRMGDPMRGEVQMGPKVSRAELEKVEAFVERAVKQGASVALGGTRPAGKGFKKGFWFEPTVLTGVQNDMDIVQNEVFGPVLPVQPFEGFEEAVSLANDSRYGLSAYIFTSDLHRAMRAVDDIDFGEVYINKIGPEQVQGFHTGYRMSGLGGDDGEYGYERYLRKKTVYLAYDGHDAGAAPSNFG